MPGAGFFVAPRIVVTCAHVIGDSEELRVRWERDGRPATEAPVKLRVAVLADGGRPIPALDTDYPDIAVLGVDGLDEHPCVLVDGEWPSLQDTFQVYGYPREGGAVQLTPARLAYRGTHGVQPTAYMDLASDTVKPGMSGAALLNLRSRAVCGVVVASKHVAQPDGALAIPWSVVEPRIRAVLTANREFHDRDRRWAGAAAAHRQRLRFRLPPTVSHFTGRSGLLARLDSALTTRQTAIISGLGGVGKTQLAAAFAAAHQDAFDIAAWVRAEDGGVADLADLAVALALPVGERTPSQRASDVLTFLSNTDRRWLLVLDNVAGPEAVRELPASGNGRILITTRHRGGFEDFGPELSVDVFDPDTALEYLLARTGRTNEERDAQAVAAAVGFLPLALAHAGAYCAPDVGIPFSEYLELLDSLPSQELYDSNREVFYQRTVAATWTTSIAAAEQHAALARPALEMTAYLAASIPRAFLSVLDEHSARGRKRISDAVSALHRYSLVSVTGNQIHVHRLLQKVVRDQLDGQAATAAAANALAAVEAAFPSDHLPRTWPQWQELLPQVAALAQIDDVAGIDAARLVAVLNSMCSFLQAAGPPLPARTMASRAVGISGRHLDPGHLVSLTARERLADSYRHEMPAQAIEILEPLVTDSERILGPEHEFTLEVRNLLGDAHRYAQKPAKAIKILQPLAADIERILGAEHELTLSVRNSLALSFQMAGRLAKALPLLEQLADAHERLLGSEDLSTLISRYNLAGTYVQAGRNAQARPIFEQLAADTERILGPTHPITIGVRQWLDAGIW
jgi:tetratricopeptide (TPR) repeat protein